MDRDTSVSNDLIRGLEISEARAWSDLYRDPPARLRDACGLGLLSLPAADLCIASKIDVLAFNRTLALGLGAPVTDADLDELIDCLRNSGVRRAFAQVSPLASPDDLVARLEKRGFAEYNRWVKLVRGVDPVPETRTDLTVAVITAEHAGAFGTLAAQCLGWPEPAGPWVGSLVGRPGWAHYMAFDGDRPVATAAMFVREGTGWIDFAATLPDCRGRGAQGALTARRIGDAARLGCRYLGVETAADTPEHPSPSYRNMVRYGFTTAYERANHLFTVS